MSTTIVPAPTWFEGHFPDRPILPGVAQLALVLEELTRTRGVPHTLRAIRSVRFRQPVYPGEALELRVADSLKPSLRFEWSRAGSIVTNGEIGVTQAHDGDLVSVRSTENTLASASSPELDELLPHRAPMRFVTGIVAERPDGLDCTAAVPERCALAREGSAPALAVLEAAAQTAAAWEAVRRRRAGGDTRPRVGYIVGLHAVNLLVERIATGTSFETCIRLQAAALPLAHYRIDAALAGTTIATGTIATYLA